MQADRIYSWGASHMESAFPAAFWQAEDRLEILKQNDHLFLLLDTGLCQARVQTASVPQPGSDLWRRVSETVTVIASCVTNDIRYCSQSLPRSASVCEWRNILRDGEASWHCLISRPYHELLWGSVNGCEVLWSGIIFTHGSATLPVWLNYVRKFFVTPCLNMVLQLFLNFALGAKLGCSQGFLVFLF